MADLSLVSVSVAAGASVTSALVAASGGGDTAPTGRCRFLYIDNADASSHTVTVATPGQVDGLAIADMSIAVPAGESAVVPLSRTFADPSTGKAAISYSAATGMSVAAFELEI